jgi:hypothetical protein
MLPLQDQLIIALLNEPTYAQAAAKVGVPETTMYRWLREPAFKAAYRAARRDVLEGAISKLQQHTASAVDALARALTCGRTRDETRAADLILSHAIKGMELLDLAERLEHLEERMKDEG